MSFKPITYLNNKTPTNSSTVFLVFFSCGSLILQSLISSTVPKALVVIEDIEWTSLSLIGCDIRESWHMDMCRVLLAEGGGWGDAIGVTEFTEVIEDMGVKGTDIMDVLLLRLEKGVEGTREDGVPMLELTRRANKTLGTRLAASTAAGQLWTEVLGGASIFQWRVLRPRFTDFNRFGSKYENWEGFSARHLNMSQTSLELRNNYDSIIHGVI